MRQPDDRQRHGRRILLLVAVAFFGPLALAVVLYTTNTWRPGGAVQHGELLLNAHPLTDLPMPPPLGGQTPAQLHGRWSMVMFGPGTCEGTCAERLKSMRQIRVALGKEMARVQRIFCVSDSAVPPAGLAADNLGLIILTDSASVASLGQGLGEHADGDIFIVDPLGNPVLRFEAKATMSDIHKDLQHLLKGSEIG